MPLDLPGLTDAIASIAASPPATVAGCAQAWGDAMGSYASGVVPASTTAAAAATALGAALVSAFGSPDAAPGMEAAFAAFAVSVGGGMAGAGFAPVPPPGPVGFADQFATPAPPTHAAAAAAIAARIDTWMRTGIGTLIAPPNTPTPWT